MAFYIIEKKEQLDKIGWLGDCFVDFIQYNNNSNLTTCLL
jgi:hypothetical protein